MKAVVFTKYGSPEVLELKEIDKPVPKDNEVLVKIYAASVNFGDLFIRNFKEVTPRKFNMPFILWLISKIIIGFRQPKINIPGSEFAGVIDSAGKDVKKFKKGDKVFGYVGQKMGAYAEYLCMPENGTITQKPDNLNFAEAAAAPYGFIMAINLLQKVNIRAGQKILINGASGGIGSAAVRLANFFGAEVTGTCGTPRMEYVKALGADYVIDYTKENFYRNGRTYDLIFDILGKSSFPKCKSSLNENGQLLYASFKMMQILQMLFTSITGNKKVICAIAPGSAEDLISVKEIIETGKIKFVIDKCFPLEQAADAHRYAEEGSRKGSIIITIANENNKTNGSSGSSNV